MTKPTTNASNNESRSWRELASTHRLAMAVLAGILATHIATITGYWYHGIGMPDLDWPRFNGYLLERTGVLAAGGKVPAGDITKDLGWFLLAFAIFNTYMLLWSTRLNMSVFLVFLTLEITEIVLFLGFFSDSTSLISLGGYIGVVTAIVAWYASAAVVANSMRAKPILPVGNPIWS